MTDENDPDDENSGSEEPDHLQQQFQFQPLSARVPERVARGVFSTGAIVLQGPDEFIIDFILRLAHPHQVVARIVLPVMVVRYRSTIAGTCSLWSGCTMKTTS